MDVDNSFTICLGFLIKRFSIFHICQKVLVLNKKMIKVIVETEKVEERDNLTS